MRVGLRTAQRAPRRASILMAAIAVTTILVVAQVGCAPAATPQAQRTIDLINFERAAVGLPALRRDVNLEQLAQNWSRHMSEQQRVFHSNAAAEAEFIGVAQFFVLFGENVGSIPIVAGEPMSASIDRAHRAFMASPGHRAAILGPWDVVGIGTFVGPCVGPGNCLWVTQRFGKVR